MTTLTAADLDFSAADLLPAGSAADLPADIAAIMDAMLYEPTPFFKRPEEGIFAHGGLHAIRGDYNEVVQVRTTDPVYGSVSAQRILERFADALPEPNLVQHSKRYSTHLCLDLYSYSHTAGLAAVQIRRGDWDSKHKFGKVNKTYVVADTFGNRLVVTHGKLRAAARLHPYDLVRPLEAALKDFQRHIDVDARRPVNLKK